MTQQRKLLGKILEEMKVVTAVQIKQALKAQMADPGKKIGEILRDMKACTDPQITEALARQYNYPFVDLKTLKINAEAVKVVPRSVCEENSIYPIKANGKSLMIAMHDPLDLFALDNIKFILNREIDVALAPKDEIIAAITRAYGSREKSDMSAAIDLAAQTQTEIKVRGGSADTGADGEPDPIPARAPPAEGSA